MSKKGGKKDSARESLYNVLHAQNPNITREMVRQAGDMTGMREMLKLYSAPSAGEKYNTAAIGRLKTDEQIQAEQEGAFANTRKQVANMSASAKGLESAFTGALGSAAGNLLAFGGSNAAALQGLVNAGEASTSDTTGATTGMFGASAMGGLLTDIAQTQGITSAKSQRTAAGEGYRKERAGLRDVRRNASADLRSKNRAAIVSMVGSLLGLAPAGGSGGGYGGGQQQQQQQQQDPMAGLTTAEISRWDPSGGSGTGYGDSPGADRIKDKNNSSGSNPETNTSSSGTGSRGSHAGTYPAYTPSPPNYSGEDRGDTSGPTIGPAVNKKRVWVPPKTFGMRGQTRTEPGYWSYQ